MVGVGDTERLLPLQAFFTERYLQEHPEAHEKIEKLKDLIAWQVSVGTQPRGAQGGGRGVVTSGFATYSAAHRFALLLVLLRTPHLSSEGRSPERAVPAEGVRVDAACSTSERLGAAASRAVQGHEARFSWELCPPTLPALGSSLLAGVFSRGRRAGCWLVKPTAGWVQSSGGGMSGTGGCRLPK